MTSHPKRPTSIQTPDSTDPGATGEDALEASIRAHHWLVLVLSVLAMILSFVLHLRPDGALAVPGLDRAIPGVCMSQRMLGVSCPGCGLTRSFVTLAHGRVDLAFAFHRMGPIVFLVVALQPPYRLAALRTPGPKRGVLWTTIPRWTCYGLLALLAGNWLTTLALGTH